MQTTFGILAAEPLSSVAADLFSVFVTGTCSVDGSGVWVAVTVSVSVTRVTFLVAVTVVGVAASSPEEHARSLRFHRVR